MRTPHLAVAVVAAVALTSLCVSGCQSSSAASHTLDMSNGTDVAPGTENARHGDEIVIAGRYFRTGTPVVLWTDPGGYDAYRTEYRFEPFDKRRYDPEVRALLGPQRYNLREDRLSDEELEDVRGGGWTLDLLRRQIDQFVIHYDVCGVSRQCFRILHDIRGLSVHFMLDVDGTIYQTLDVKERAWHAAQANSRSIGIEIANIGAYPPPTDQRGPGAPLPETLETWYETDTAGIARLTLPAWLGDGGIRTPNFVAKPARAEPVYGDIHGSTYAMYDLTPEQYHALIRLTATLCTVFPEISADYPRGPNGEVLTRAFTEEEYNSFGGLVGHFHLTEGKNDPGPAFDWDRVVDGAQAIMPRRER